MGVKFLMDNVVITMFLKIQLNMSSEFDFTLAPIVTCLMTLIDSPNSVRDVVFSAHVLSFQCKRLNLAETRNFATN